MANSDYLIAGNDEHGLEPLPTDSSELLPPEKVNKIGTFYIFRHFS